MRRADLAAAALLAGLTTIVFVLLYGPLMVPILSSFFAVSHGTVDWSQPTLSAYAALTGNESVLAALWTTLVVGACAVALSVAIGTGLALYYASPMAKGREFLQFLLFLPFLMPPIITGLALLIFFREIAFERSLVTIVIGHTVFVLALVYRTILTRLQSLSASLVEASYDLGASGWQTFRLVLLPNLSSAMAGAAILAFALSFDETMITLLVTGTQSTLPVRLWAMMRLGFTPDINALVALILFFTTALCLGAVRFLMPASALAGTEQG
ncbi:ABC transporter permease [Labrys wisconsinensis]|uniref:Spermidine/putrescine transport system permease protein/spermidine/putrescine transport system permease protein n=1 Tax=Labrys wisconsinensis TaxID=425677 RepID=A0ABU0JJ04_9HYPH|nr:ABC transporter permease [Labrys wisconsinensis]MDQ0474252.1 putative spermidine/putrescine transport system permease protein/spermidine/putrescine transport system permease protein [Labrys wisconsinensis]